jgi:hypothetical protein
MNHLTTTDHGLSLSEPHIIFISDHTSITSSVSHKTVRVSAPSGGRRSYHGSGNYSSSA